MSISNEEKQKRIQEYDIAFKVQIEQQKKNIETLAKQEKEIEFKHEEKTKLQKEINELRAKFVSKDGEYIKRITEADEEKAKFIKMNEEVNKRSENINELKKNLDKLYEHNRMIISEQYRDLEETKQKVKEQGIKYENLLKELVAKEVSLSSLSDTLNTLKEHLEVQGVEVEKRLDTAKNIEKDVSAREYIYKQNLVELDSQRKNIEILNNDYTMKLNNLKKYETELKDRDIELEARSIDLEKMSSKVRDLIKIHNIKDINI